MSNGFALGPPSFVIRNSSFAIRKAVGHEGVEMGVEAEVFAEGVEGEDDGGM